MSGNDINYSQYPVLAVDDEEAEVRARHRGPASIRWLAALASITFLAEAPNKSRANLCPHRPPIAAHRTHAGGGLKNKC